MGRITRALVLLALLATAFGAGYWVRSTRDTLYPQMEGYALANVLDNVAKAAYLSKGELPQLRDLIDISLNGHLWRIVQSQRSVNDPKFEASEIRVLNAAARLWDTRPPFSYMTERMADADWLSEWNVMTAKNMELLEWAKNQCAANPALKCATDPIGR